MSLAKLLRLNFQVLMELRLLQDLKELLYLLPNLRQLLIELGKVYKAEKTFANEYIRLN